MEKQATNAVELAPIPRTITKAALRNYFNLSKRRFRHLVTEDVVEKMQLDTRAHNVIKEYNQRQTMIIVQSLRLSDDELREIARLM